MPNQERTLRLQAVVLQHQDWGEADRMLVLFTREQGKLRAIAKGVRKLRSRKAGHLEPFTRVNLLLARGRDLLIVTQAETVESYQGLREKLNLIGQASYVVELLDRFTYEEGENIPLYRLLTDTLARLSSGEPPAFVVRYYELRLLDLLGFRPHLFQCAACEKEIQAEDQFYSLDLGGVLCPVCGKREAGSLPISMPALRHLRHLQRSSYSEAARLKIPDGANQEMEHLVQRYLTHLLERKLNTPDFIRRMRRKG